MLTTVDRPGKQHTDLPRKREHSRQAVCHHRLRANALRNPYESEREMAWGKHKTDVGKSESGWRAGECSWTAFRVDVHLRKRTFREDNWKGDQPFRQGSGPHESRSALGHAEESQWDIQKNLQNGKNGEVRHTEESLKPRQAKSGTYRRISVGDLPVKSGTCGSISEFLP